MDRDVQLSEPAAHLLATAVEVAPGWMMRITLEAASVGGFSADRLAPQLDSVVAVETPQLVEALGILLATDVDEQRTNPLSVFRESVTAPTALLQSVGVPPPEFDQFAAERFPEDLYRLGPAAWSDIDPRMHEPGLIWGAWKAMTVLRRRRDEGLR